MFRCKGTYSDPAKSIVVLSKMQSPTRDLYLVDRLKTAKLPVHYWSLGEKSQYDLEGAFVIIVRYVDRKSMAALLKAKDKIAGVAYLMDDDIAGSCTDASLPKHYRFVMAQFWARWRQQLQVLASELWLSSDVLVDVCGGGERIDPWVEPFPLPKERFSGDGNGRVRIACHTSKTHRGDLIWLSSIIAEVQRRCDHTDVEIIGDRKAIRHYRGLPRVTAMSSMSWTAYKDYVSSAPRVDIGLVPVSESRFNRARSWAKYIDVTRWGAVGVYSQNSAYDSVVEHEVNGLLISNDDPENWVDTIVKLSTDYAYRTDIAQRIGIPTNVNTPSSLSWLCSIVP